MLCQRVTEFGTQNLFCFPFLYFLYLQFFSFYPWENIVVETNQLSIYEKNYSMYSFISPLLDGVWFLGIISTFLEKQNFYTLL